jgi:hypothetical protein
VDEVQEEHPLDVGIEDGKEARQVIAHVVLFRPKAHLSDDDRTALILSLQTAVDGIPTIRRARIGRRILLNRPGYETQMAEHFEYSAILEFDSESDLRAYLDHPAHEELGMRLYSSAAAVLAYDYESVEPSRVADLIK